MAAASKTATDTRTEVPPIEMRSAEPSKSQQLAPIEPPRSAPIYDGEFRPEHLRDAIEFAKLMAQSGPMVPKHCRDNPAVCLGIFMRASHWKADPFAVADKSYLVKQGQRRAKRGQDQNEDDDRSDDVGRIAYEASLIHAVIQRFGNLVGDLETKYEGELKPHATNSGEFVDDRRIIVTGRYVQNGVVVEREYKSPPVSKIAVKNSPLWNADLEQQLHYFGTRSWARRWRPGVILGVYTVEELQYGQDIETDADRAQAIEYRRGDVLSDDVTVDPDAPPETAPIAHRFSYQLEQVPTNPVNQPQMQAVYLRFQPEIEAMNEKSREKLRDLYALHIRRLKGEVPQDEALEQSRKYRDPEASG